MSISLNVLLIEDDESDALLIVRELQKSGFDVIYERIDALEALRKALGKPDLDIIISDYSIPHLSGFDAIRILQDSGRDIPFIVVSGAVSEEGAIEMMRSGAQDFIIKSNLSRLAPAVSRELRQAKMRHEHKRAEEALRRSEENFRAIFEHVPAAVFAYDKNGIVLHANPLCEQLFAIPRDRMVGRSMFDTVAQTKDREEIRQRIDYIFSGGSIENIEWLDILEDGRQLYILTNITPVYGPDGKVIMGLSLNIDITDRKLAENREKELEAHKREFYRRTILAATEGKLEISDREEICRIAGAPIEAWKLNSPEDVSNIRHLIADFAENAGMESTQEYNLVLCAGEATTNAVKHANGGAVSVHRIDDSILVVVSDEGSGIEALNLPDVALTKGYSTAGTLGMGYKTMTALADKVYLATGPTGTTVAMKMSLKPSVQPDIWALSG